MSKRGSSSGSTSLGKTASIFCDEEIDKLEPDVKKQKKHLDNIDSVTGEVVEETTTTLGEDVSEVEEDEDPLDSYMKQVETRIQHEKDHREKHVADSIPDFLPIRDDIEQADEIESYVTFLASKGIDVEELSARTDHSKLEGTYSENSDEEVYATARAIDSSYGEESNLETSRKSVQPLPPVDHHAIVYPHRVKHMYRESEVAKKMTDEEVELVRNAMSMKVSGDTLIRPCLKFELFGFDGVLLKSIEKQGFTEPTPIQKQTIPIALSGRDIIGVAKTGSGKTAAFVWPMLMHVMNQSAWKKGVDGPMALILTPTRELCQQVYQESKKYARDCSRKVSCIYGGADKLEQFRELRTSSSTIVVATPGRWIDMIRMKATNQKSISYVVLDEADRMLDMGFEPQVRSIVQAIRPDRQTLLFSATFRRSIEKLAHDLLNDPIKITIGRPTQGNPDIIQSIVVLPSDVEKWDWLMENLQGFSQQGSILIFVNRIGIVNDLSHNLRVVGFSCIGLHGDMIQTERDHAISEFRQGRVTILVATDVAGRGLDIKSVKTVVNYDAAQDIDSHIHRIGRTGRAGEKGIAYTLLNRKERRLAVDLVHHLRASHQSVPEELLQLAMENARFSIEDISDDDTVAHGKRNYFNSKDRSGMGLVPSQTSSSQQVSRQHIKSSSLSAPLASRFRPASS